MNLEPLQTKNLKLVPQTRDDVIAYVQELNADEMAQVSAAWLALVDESNFIDPWIHGYSMLDRATGGVVGTCGFKGPPGEDGLVEIAYGVAPEHQGKGYATEAAAALVKYAIESGQVRAVRAHTLPKSSASVRVLTKCGFRQVGEVLDPDDGPVWRWETP
jgi:[ribosomal protein S5]-alanine N-acetyltransferase